MALTFENVTKQFDGTEAPAVRELTFSIGTDESAAIIGPSGAGKTTLLRLASGAIQAEEGRVLVDGSEHRHSGDVALVYQDETLIGRRTALENALVGKLGSYSRLRGLIEPLFPNDTDRAIELLDSAGLGDYIDTRADELSAGERQRVAIVRALLQDSQVLLADEPTANLDPTTSETVLDLLETAAANGALAVVMHDVDLALERFDRVIGVSDGRLQFDRSADRVGTELLSSLFEDHSELPTAPEVNAR
jgi:phosphonate transport system ATP-binding protein